MVYAQDESTNKRFRLRVGDKVIEARWRSSDENTVRLSSEYLDGRLDTSFYASTPAKRDVWSVRTNLLYMSAAIPEGDDWTIIDAIK